MTIKKRCTRFINRGGELLCFKEQYKYIITAWTQPTLTSNTSYGIITGGGYYTTDENRDYYHISDGNYTTSWGTNNSSTGWFNWKFPQELIITGIKVYNRQHATVADYTLTGARFYTDSTKTTPIGDEFSITTSGTAYEIVGIPSEGIQTKNLYFYKTGSAYSGLGEIQITALVKTKLSTV